MWPTGIGFRSRIKRFLYQLIQIKKERKEKKRKKKLQYNNHTISLWIYLTVSSTTKRRKKRLRDRKRWKVRTILPPMRKGLVKCDKGEIKNEKGWEGKEREVFEWKKKEKRKKNEILVLWGYQRWNFDSGGKGDFGAQLVSHPIMSTTHFLVSSLMGCKFFKDGL